MIAVSLPVQWHTGGPSPHSPVADFQQPSALESAARARSALAYLFSTHLDKKGDLPIAHGMLRSSGI